ncbi:hypothetical protein [Phenylobacterium sp.]|uniref:hypothetical protein n=1 Tax=Phenylobacterium sp. TaxID=1871053 RepID=UPI0027321DC5|nr:hypothetical protein [Phenylobacterium sp.]MDP1616230.1 hypothetical protein [Phenylobacterium sp.]MDP1985774.1 hypothetical protein [Phenylobacterium sp.]
MPFVPSDFEIPRRLEHAEFRLRPLTIHDVVKDYAAVMTSLDRLAGVFGPGNDWPRADMTLEEDLVDLGWHQGEFERRTSFAFTMMSPDESQCLGCAYIYPASRPGYDAKAYCWVRASAAHLDAPLYEAFRAWLASDWPFERTAFPGRDVSWADWGAT